AVAVTACGGSGTPSLTAAAGDTAIAPASTPSPTQAGAGNSDPCALVTAAEAQAAMGVPVATTRPTGSGGYHVCDYASADGRTALEVTRIDPSGDGSDKTTFELAYGAGQAVAGVGDDAFFNADLSALTVLQNGTVVNVGLSNAVGVSAAQMQAVLTKVVLAALGRL
ncbi:MAG: hypothetical protein ACREOE_16195, partial [Gemmatimonadales bacterium]